MDVQRCFSNMEWVLFLRSRADRPSFLFLFLAGKVGY